MLGSYMIGMGRYAKPNLICPSPCLSFSDRSLSVFVYMSELMTLSESVFESEKSHGLGVRSFLIPDMVVTFEFRKPRFRKLLANRICKSHFNVSNFR